MASRAAPLMRCGPYCTHGRVPASALPLRWQQGRCNRTLLRCASVRLSKREVWILRQRRVEQTLQSMATGAAAG